MMGQKICFYGEIWLIIPILSLLPLLIWSTGPSEQGLHYLTFLKQLSDTSLCSIINLFKLQDIEDLTLVVISYKTIMSVRFCLLYDLLKWDFIAFKMNNISRRKYTADIDIVNDVYCMLLEFFLLIYYHYHYYYYLTFIIYILISLLSFSFSYNY